MPTAYLLPLLALVLVLVAMLHPPTRSRLAYWLTSARDRLRHRAPSKETNVVVIDEAGGEHHVAAGPSAARDRQSRGARLRESLRIRREQLMAIQMSRRLLAALVILLIGMLALWRFSGLFSNKPEKFTVLVAPLQDANGAVSQTGLTVADALVEDINKAGYMHAERVDAPPGDVSAALQQIQREGADALVWGSVSAGGMFDQESIVPKLAYRPSGAFAPLSWAGYNGRFALPEAYALSSAPISGKAVLVPLLDSLARYGDNNEDAAYANLGTLLDHTSALAPALPRAIRGNIMWARGEYAQAADEYRRALGQPAQGEMPDLRPALTNNLGAILQDGDDGDAEKTLLQTVDLLQGQDMGALRYNLGLQYLRQNQAEQAASSLVIARNLLPPNTDLLITLGRAYREAKNYPAAHEALSAAEKRLGDEVREVPSALADLTTQRLRGNLAEQRALLALAETLQAQGPLMWELQIRDQIDGQALSSISKDLSDSVDQTQALLGSWNSRSAMEDASAKSIGGLLAVNQAQQANQLLRARQIWKAALVIETARMQGFQAPSGLAALWSQISPARSPLTQSRNDLQQLLDLQPKDVDAGVLYGEVLLLTSGGDAARDAFNKAAEADSQRPEPLYGKALVEQSVGRDQLAIDALQQAIKLDPSYFPARERLADIAEVGQIWDIAIEQRRWLAQNRPSQAQTLSLAAALRHSGSDNYAAAEETLLSVVNDTAITDAQRIPALVELGRLYNDSGNATAARTVLERAQKADSRNPTIAYELGRALEMLGDSDAAAQQFQLAIANDQQPIRARLELAKFYTERATAVLQQTDVSISSTAPLTTSILSSYIQDIREANTQYRAALDAGASDKADLELIGSQLLSSGDYDGAVLAYRQLAQAQSKDPEAQHNLARAELLLGNFSQARTAEQKAIELSDGPYPIAQSGLGDISLGQKLAASTDAQRQTLHDQAAQEYNAALQQQPGLGDAEIGLGQLAAQENNWAVAAAHFRSAIGHTSRNAEAHVGLGTALLEQNDAKTAIMEFNQAIYAAPGYAEAYYGLARVQFATNQIDPARANLGLALMLRSSYAEAWLALGKLEEHQGDDKKALSAYSSAISANRRLAEPPYRRAILYIRQEQMDDAEADLSTAIKLQTPFSEAHYWLGRVYLAQTRPQAARSEFQTAVEQQNGNYPDALFYQGIAEEQLGQREAATTSFQGALDQSSASAWANEARAAISRLKLP